MKRFTVLIGIVAALGLGAPVTAAPAFPTSVPLPDGFYPEGIAVGTGHDFYAGSLLDGSIYRGDLRTGAGEVIAPGAPGRFVVGLSFDRRSGLLWGVGVNDGSGAAMAFHGKSGELVAAVAIPGVFLNDVVVTRQAAYITDSLADVLWSIPLDQRGRPAGPPEAIPLTGDFTFVAEGELPINLNGIAATPDGSTLFAVHTSLGVLYRIDPSTGEATQIDLGDGFVPFGDGIVLHGKRLYVVQNFVNQVAVVTLDPGFASGEITEVITSDLFRVPTTAARFGNHLYVVNARFDVAFPPVLGGELMAIDYDVVKVSR